MPVEEQLIYDTDVHMYGPNNNVRMGQCFLNIRGRAISDVSFLLKKQGVISGGSTVYFVIYRKADYSVLVEKYLMDATDLTTGWDWYTVTWDAPAIINEDVMIVAELRNNFGTFGNSISYPDYTGDIKGGDSEFGCRFSGGSWEFYMPPHPQRDGTYKYTYQAAAAVITDAGSSIAATTAKGNGEITDLGGSAITEHGHVWSTSE